VGDVEEDVDKDQDEQQATADDRDPAQVALDVGVLLGGALGEGCGRVDRGLGRLRLRAALTSLLETDEREPAAALEMIRAGLVKYDRRAKR